MYCTTSTHRTTPKPGNIWNLLRLPSVLLTATLQRRFYRKRWYRFRPSPGNIWLGFCESLLRRPMHWCFCITPRNNPGPTVPCPSPGMDQAMKHWTKNDRTLNVAIPQDVETLIVPGSSGKKNHTNREGHAGDNFWPTNASHCPRAPHGCCPPTRVPFLRRVPSQKKFSQGLPGCLKTNRAADMRRAGNIWRNMRRYASP